MQDKPFAQIRPDYEPDGTLRYVPITNEFAVPRRFWADGEPVSVHIEVDPDHGEVRCVEVVVRGERLTSDDLRLPLARLVRRAVAGAAVALPLGSAASIDPVAVLAGLSRRGTSELDFYERYVNGVDRPRRGRPVSDEHLQRVAALYRAAVERRDPPTRTVADKMHASRATAARWVTLARKRGMLGAAARGKAGELANAADGEAPGRPCFPPPGTAAPGTLPADVTREAHEHTKGR